MADLHSYRFRFPVLLATVVAIAIVALVAAGDYFTSRQVNPTFLYAVSVTVVAIAMHRRLMWAFASVSVALTIGLFLIKLQGLPDYQERALLANRMIASAGILLLSAILHGFVGTYRRLMEGRELLQKRREELEAANTELAAREEEITSQNEELQSQTEELERQSEELRITNEELARREKLLEILLSLSRALTADLPRDEALERICRTLGQVINQHNHAAAILLREPQGLVVRCHYGFGSDGPATSVLPYLQSFASLVIERNRTGFLEDVALRPELRLAQPKEERKFHSVLATPLRVNGDAIGTLEAYSYEKHAWSDDQIAMIESLASQTSISLQAAELYERIEHERTRLQAVLETVPFSVSIANADLSDIRLNPAGAALHRVPANTNIVSLRETSRVKLFQSGNLVPETQHPLVRAVAYGEVLTNREFELLVDGTQRHVLLYSAAPVRDASGKILGGVAAAADISEQKRLQLELDARRREAEEASARKTRFLAAVSHDIRTPANAISLLAELMQRSAATPALQGEIPQLANDLRNNALSLVTLVSDVLDLTRFDSGRIDLDESEFMLDSLIWDECRRVQAIAKEKGLEFRCEPPEPVKIRTDRVKLTRILGNLVSNAMKFTTHGSVAVRGGASRESGVWLEVCDTGPGIPKEYQDRIFDEFFQIKRGGILMGNQTSTQVDGSGLGLAICRRLVHAMGGTISVESNDGQGSRFRVALPANVIVPI